MYLASFQTASSHNPILCGNFCSLTYSSVYFSYPASEHSITASTSSLEENEQEEEKHTTLLHSVQVQLNLERTLRETAELEAEALAREISELEPRLTLLEAYKARLAEVEAEVEDLRQLVRSDSASCMLPSTLFFPSDEEVSEIWETKRRSGKKQLLDAGRKDEDLSNEHSDACMGHLEAANRHGMSLLHEMDTQYSALQRKYNALLHHFEVRTQSQCDKAVQTSTASQYATLNPVTHRFSQDCAQLPEYKTLFNEIFTYIQNSKKELNRAKST